MVEPLIQFSEDATSKNMAKAKVTEQTENIEATQGEQVVEETQAVAQEAAPEVEAKAEEKAPKKSEKPSEKSQASSKPLTMEDLLAGADYSIKVPQTGDITQGEVVGITKKMVLVDIGGKTEGLVMDKEFQQAQDFIENLKVGDTVDVYVVEGQNQNGQTILSLKRAMMDKKWDELTALQEKDETVKVYGVETNRGGMVVTYDGLRGFIPTSQFGREVSSKLDSLRGKEFEAKILEVNKEQNRLIFSERLVSEADVIANSEAALEAVKEGATVEGVITGIKPFGIFVAVEVDLGDGKLGVLEGLVHVSEVSWDRIENLNALYKKGQKIQTRVLAVSKDHGKLTLSIKQLLDDPWDAFVENNPAGSTVTGTVSRVVPFGVFVTIASGIDGLIHESKLGGETFMAGDEVTVSIDSIDGDQRRVSLSPATTDVPVMYK